MVGRYHTSFDKLLPRLKAYQEEAKVTLASEVHSWDNSYMRLDWFPGKSGLEQYLVFHHQSHKDSTYRFHTLEEALDKFLWL